MVLKEEVQDNIYTCYFDSSNILACQYYANVQILSLIFKSGKQYNYKNITPTEYQLFKIAKSQGKYFNENLKNAEFEPKGVIPEKEKLYEIIENLKKQ